jgi:hypothetical protein
VGTGEYPVFSYLAKYFYMENAWDNCQTETMKVLAGKISMSTGKLMNVLYAVTT